MHPVTASYLALVLFSHEIPLCAWTRKATTGVECQRTLIGSTAQRVVRGAARAIRFRAGYACGIRMMTLPASLLSAS
jgi:hypothetical protein